MSVYDQFRSFYRELPPHSKARIINADGSIADASQLGLSLKHQSQMMHLIQTPEKLIGARRISDFFSKDFFHTHFWTLWRTRSLIGKCFL